MYMYALTYYRYLINNNVHVYTCHVVYMQCTLYTVLYLLKEMTLCPPDWGVFVIATSTVIAAIMVIISKRIKLDMYVYTDHFLGFNILVITIIDREVLFGQVLCT
jgi:hypothetical protein